MNSPACASPTALVDAAGLRRTQAALALAALFSSAQSQSLSHAQVQQALVLRGVVANRVTVYRLLNRFVACGLLQAAPGLGRSARFALGQSAAAGMATPRFECNTCHLQIPLQSSAAPAQRATQQAFKAAFKAMAAVGHHGHTAELAIRGTCAACWGRALAPLQESA
jgi:Fur family transcriptional regulator, ferric uptake regulator